MHFVHFVHNEDHNFIEKFKPFRLKLLNFFYIGLRIVNLMSKQLPNFLRFKDLAKNLKIDNSDLFSSICIRYKNSLYSKYEGVWYQFRKLNDVIIPYSISKSIASALGIKTQSEKLLTLKKKFF